MAKDKAVTETTATATPAVSGGAEAKFPVETLRKDCMKLYGVTISTFDGAFCGKSGEYTIEEGRNVIENWKKGVVEV
jgi:hypothetical protein